MGVTYPDNLVNGTGRKQRGTIWLQIKGCLMVMMWVFVGIEGAKCFNQPREKETFRAQQASIIGPALFIVYLYPFASILPYGVLSQEELATILQPAMAEIF